MGNIFSRGVGGRSCNPNDLAFNVVKNESRAPKLRPGMHEQEKKWFDFEVRIRASRAGEAADG